MSKKIFLSLHFRLFISITLFLLKANSQIQESSTSNTLSANCQEKFFFNLYYAPDSYSRSHDLLSMQDSGVIAIGETRRTDPNDYIDGLITRFNKEGGIIWNKAINGPGSQVITSITQLADGNLAVFGVQEVSLTLGYFLIKLDVNGNILWRKDYQIQNTGERLGLCKIKEDTNGSLIVIAQFLENGLSFSDRVLFLKADSNGNLLRSQFFKPPGFISFMNINDMMLSDGYTYVVGGYYTDGIKGLLLKIDNSTGTLIWSKYYSFNNKDAEFLQIFPYSNNRFCITAQDDLNPKDTSLFLTIDTAGLCTSSTYLQFNAGWPRQFGSAAQTGNHDVIWAMYYYRSPTDLTSFTLSRVHPENGIVYSKDFSQIDRFPIIYKTIIGRDSSIYSTGFKGDTGGNYPLFLGKFSKNGELGCPSTSIPAKFGSGTTTTSPLAMTASTRTYLALPRANFSADHIFTIDNICTTVSFCDTIKIRGQNTLCDLQTSLTFTAYKNAECILPVSWDIDNTAVESMTQINDTTIQIYFNQNWQGYLYAEIETSCGILIDSVWLTVLNSPGQVHLGLDRNICPDNTIALNAGPGYKNYLWQDGSTNSIFTVTSPGIYWVQAIDACNVYFRDTITITPSPAIPFDLGPDLVKCNSDSVTITAPAGFINYTWSPNYNITTVTGQSVIVFPAGGTMYKVAAEKTPGCFAYDSIYIHVNNSKAIFLGADTSFCSGNWITLNAGTGFNSYLWNSGQTDASIIVNTPGIFYVAATDINDCISRDTLKVLNVFNNPVVTLPKDSLLCRGSSKTFTVTSGMTAYNWSTGSTSNSITTNTIGVYWVNVIDNNGCPGTDTTRITRLLSLPKGFLPLDTALCSYSSMRLSASSVYQSYLWNTGSTQPSITINEAGIYSLRVVDNLNCVGTDTIVIDPKQCQEGFFIPNAFTPNKNGLNDNFRPLLFGIVLQYKFKIYNRWGELVFESSQLEKGWNGKMNGRETDSNVFVWTCEFQFEGQKYQLKKGTVTLIR